MASSLVASRYVLKQVPTSVTYRERFDALRMRQIIRKMEANTLIIADGQKPQLKGYLKKHGVDPVGGIAFADIEYTPSPYTKYGRLYAKGGLQGLDGHVVETITHRLVWDIDMVCAHPTIFVELMRHAGVDCPAMRFYLANRDPTLDAISRMAHVSRDAAKELMNRALFGGTVDSWVKAHCDASAQGIQLPDEVIKYIKEVEKGTKILNDLYPEIATGRVKKAAERDPAISTLAIILHTAETHIVQCLAEWLEEQGRTVESLKFDGVTCNRTDYDDADMPKNLDTKVLDAFIVEKLNFNVSFIIKPMKRIIPDVEPLEVNPEELKNEYDAAQALIRLHGVDNFKISNKALYVFDPTTGMWQNDPPRIHSIFLSRYIPSLDTYLTSQRKWTPTLTYLKSFDELIDNSFPSSTIGSSKGLFLFKNGVYNVITKEFTTERSPEFFFPGVIPRYFRPIEDDEENILSLMRQQFRSFYYYPMGNNLVSAVFLLQFIGRALAGHAEDKRIGFNVGLSNSGKSTYATINIATFPGYCAAFDAQLLSYCPNVAEKNRNRHYFQSNGARRIFYASELDKQAKLSGGALKEMCGGSDQVQSRGLYAETASSDTCFTLVFSFNDAPQFSSALEDAVLNRIQTFNYERAFKVGATAKDISEGLFPADDRIGDKYKTQEALQEAWSHLLFEAYVPSRPDVPESMRSDKEAVLSTAVSDRAIFAQHFEVTDDRNDKLTNAEIKDMVGSLLSFVKIKEMVLQEKREKNPHSALVLRDIHYKSNKVYGCRYLTRRQGAQALAGGADAFMEEKEDQLENEKVTRDLQKAEGFILKILRYESREELYEFLNEPIVPIQPEDGKRRKLN
jgi:hypothetical protein